MEMPLTFKWCANTTSLPAPAKRPNVDRRFLFPVIRERNKMWPYMRPGYVVDYFYIGKYCVF